MPFPKLSPLQSRLAASLIASVMLVLIYFAFMSPHFAYAADVDSIRPEDHNHERLLRRPFLDPDYEELELSEPTYEAQFAGVDRGIIGRATTEPITLTNNGMQETNIPQGQLMSYMFSNASLWGPLSAIKSGLPSQIILNGKVKRSVDETESAGDNEEDEEELKLRSRQSNSDNQRLLYITVTACKQPTSNTTTDPPPQLQLYVSQSQDNITPGPGKGPQVEMKLDDGYALYALNATGNVYIGVYGENVNTTYTGVWDAQIAASIDQPYHFFWNSSDPNLFLVSSDSNSALLYTDPLIPDSSNSTLAEAWMDMTPGPFTVFASDASDNSILGLQNSYCGLETKAQISASRPGQISSDIATKMTDIGSGSLPKQQFYLTGLGPGKMYNIALAMNGTIASGNSAVGAGGQVFRMTSFTTLSSVNCAVITGLSFCDQVAYSVPTNPGVFNDTANLAAFYDNATSQYYTFFQKVLAQTPCNTTSSAQYSLARTCDDCANAYKDWVCAVMIPRCTDFSSPEPWLQARAMGQPFPNGTFLDATDLAEANLSKALNGSRNPAIDQTIVPGPYKEVLPCEDLCYNLVQSCPASMQLGCPQPGVIGFNASYGVRPMGMADVNGRFANMTCNWPGVVYHRAAGGRIEPSLVLLLISAVLGMMMG